MHTKDGVTTPHGKDCGRLGVACPTLEHGFCPGCRSERYVAVTAPIEQHDDGCPVASAWPPSSAEANNNVDDVTMTATAETLAAAAACSAIYGLVAAGRSDAAKHLVNALSNELRGGVNRVMEADLPRRVAEAVNAGLLRPDEVLVDETTQPRRIVVRELTDAQEKPQREPTWTQLVESALREVLDGWLVDELTADADSFRNLVRAVQRRAEEDGEEAVEILRRLGAAKLSRVTEVDVPIAYLISRINNWTPDTDPDAW